MVFSVLGTSFGDEGKGTVVNWLGRMCSDGVVVRFSGGHQCSHTVVYYEKRHVFRCFGSATFQRLPTYFAKGTCIYPPVALGEKDKLIALGCNPELTVHPLSLLTTHFDVALNRVLERKNQHGSTGLGIGTTMARNEKSGYKLFTADILNRQILTAKLQNIYRYYTSQLNEEEKQYFDEVVSKEEPNFWHSINELPFDIQGYDYLNRFSNHIFEGSQGLLLDMNFGLFPNVTYSDLTTGAIQKVLEESIGRTPIDTYYVTRCYLTRHGNGWFPREEQLKLINNTSETNVYNEHQGNFKISEFNEDLVKQAIYFDSLSTNLLLTKNLVVTCLDQRPDFDIKKLYTFRTLNLERIFLSSKDDSSKIVTL